jgi:alpha-galactosidase
MDDFTLGLLSNDEVLDVDQDALCREATQVAGTGDHKVYAKPLEDGSWAVGLFNIGTQPATVSVSWPDLKLMGSQRVRDLWRQKEAGVFAERFEASVAPHGVVLVRISPAR